MTKEIFRKNFEKSVFRKNLPTISGTSDTQIYANVNVHI